MVVQQASFWQNSGQRRLRAIGIIGLTLLALACASCGPGSSNVAPRNQTAAPPGRPRFSQPVHLRIPALGVDADILPVGQDRYGAMEAPGAEHPASDPIWGSAYWWKYGAVPGQAGNAVLAGHVDRNDGSRAVFWNLSQLQVGDQIIINEQDGQTLTFQVTQVASFANPDGGPSDPVIQRVFGPASSANLNLITCSGAWIGTEFNQRLVIFSTLVSGA